MSIKVEQSKDSARVDVFFNNAQKATKRGIRQGFFALGKDLVRDASQLILKAPKTGRLYKIAGRKKRHRASAAGEAPANLSGKLRKSLDFKIQGSDSMEFGAGAVSDKGAPYSLYLEVGTKKMSRRPYIQPTVESNNRRAQIHFQREIIKENNRIRAK